MYRLLCGVRPFQAETTRELARMHLEDTAIPLNVRIPNLPTPLCELVEVMMAKKREARPRNGQAIVTALQSM